MAYASAPRAEPDPWPLGKYGPRARQRAYGTDKWTPKPFDWTQTIGFIKSFGTAKEGGFDFHVFVPRANMEDAMKLCDAIGVPLVFDIQLFDPDTEP